MKTKMDGHTAMFNNHVNDAFHMAKKDFIEHFNELAWDIEIQPFQKAGIMSIFEEQPNKHIAWFVARVKKYVNLTTKQPKKKKEVLALGWIQVWPDGDVSRTWDGIVEVFDTRDSVFHPKNAVRVEIRRK